ncbi:hypothetical protein OROHE_013870 [Orobanche hederae]
MASKCSCGRYTVQKMAWTEKNAGRRFVACADRYGGCGYFDWVDPPLANCENAVINGLLHRIREMEAVHMRELDEMKVTYEKEIETLKAKKGIPLYVYVMGVVCLVLLVTLNGPSNEDYVA